MPDLDWQRASSSSGRGRDDCIEVAVGEDGMIHIREASRPDEVVVTSPSKWEAFVKGVKAHEFDAFAEE